MTFYHILSRGVDKRKIFLDDEDYLRGIHDLFEFNDVEPVNNLTYFFRKEYKDVRRPYIRFDEKKRRKLLVKIHAFCLMPNHYHLLLRQRMDNGIVLFMQKLGSGYTNYFNLKYERVGSLFQGRFKALLVENDNYLLHLSRYIHLNPVELVQADWRNNKIRNLKKANKFLEKYRYSSYLDYTGRKNFPSLIHKGFINQYFESPQEYKNFIQEWVSTQTNDLKDLTLE